MPLKESKGFLETCYQMEWKLRGYKKKMHILSASYDWSMFGRWPGYAYCTWLAKIKRDQTEHYICSS